MNKTKPKRKALFTADISLYLSIAWAAQAVFLWRIARIPIDFVRSMSGTPSLWPTPVFVVRSQMLSLMGINFLLFLVASIPLLILLYCYAPKQGARLLLYYLLPLGIMLLHLSVHTLFLCSVLRFFYAPDEFFNS